MKKSYGILIVLGVLVLFVIIGVGTSNGLQRSDEEVTSKWAQVENQLQRRYDLIPNVVSVVKKYSEYEAETLNTIIARRAGATSIESEQALDAEFRQAMSAINVVVENYPELKANEEYNALIVELEGTENRISVARKDYNEAVQRLNKKIRTFPTSLIASFTGVEKRAYFEISEAAKNNPDVDSLFDQ